MPDDGDGDLRGVDVAGDGGGCCDIGVEGEEIEFLLEVLRLCFLYLT